MTSHPRRSPRRSPRLLRLARAVALFLGVATAGCGGSGSGGTPSESGDALPRYAVTDIDPRGNGAVARDIDGAGRVVGDFSETPLSPVGTRGFLWDSGAVSEFEERGARALNDVGDLVGESRGVAYLWRGEKALALAYGTAHGVNDDGAVVGEAATARGHLHAFLWSEGRIRDLGTLGGAWSVAYGVSNSGEVVGWAEREDRKIRAFSWSEGRMSDLGTLGGDWAMAYAVNDAGQIVGYSSTLDGSDHAFLAQPGGELVDLGSWAGYSVAYDVDSLGRAVGESGTPAGETHAFLWEDGELKDLNDLIPAGSGWTLTRAVAINDAGQITGEGILDGETRPFLLTPR